MIGYFIELHPELMGGGSQRTLEIIRRTHLSGLDYLIVPGITMFRRTLKEKRKRELLLKTLSKVKDKPTLNLVNILSDNSLFESNDYKSFKVKFLERNGLKHVYFDLAYTSDAYVKDFLYFKDFSRISGMLLQIEPHYKSVLEALKRYRKFVAFEEFSIKGLLDEVLRYFAYVYMSLQNRDQMLNLIKKGQLKFVLSVSASPLVLSGIDKYELLQIAVLDPAYAVEKDLWQINTKEKKEEYIVHFATLSPQKGLFDLVKVMHILRKKFGLNMKLVVFGKFSRDYYKNLFFKKIKSLGLEKLIEYKGYISDKRKIVEVVSRAKALVYPSYMDSFSLVVLETLASKTPVVAYDIPALREIYGGLSAVRLVREGDVMGLANTVNLILNKNEIYESFKDKKFLSFMEKYSSWDRVAYREFNTIRLLLENSFSK